MKILCPCGKEFTVSNSRYANGRRKYCCLKCRYKYHNAKVPHKFKEPQPTWFKKGHKTWNTGISISKEQIEKQRLKMIGRRVSIKTEFKNGHRPWNKYMEWIELREERHPMWNGGIKSYIQMAKRRNIKPQCEYCGAEDRFGHKIHIHHIDENRHNNKPDNWQILCAKCHANIHKNWEARWKTKSIVV